MSGDEQLKAGVTPEMIRVSIGIEHIDDILADLDQALDVAVPARVSDLPGAASRSRSSVAQAAAQ
jgi:hypothetical protein